MLLRAKPAVRLLQHLAIVYFFWFKYIGDTVNGVPGTCNERTKRKWKSIRHTFCLRWSLYIWNFTLAHVLWCRWACITVTKMHRPISPQAFKKIPRTRFLKMSNNLCEKRIGKIIIRNIISPAKLCVHQSILILQGGGETIQ